jgi:protein tyrosine/serine phosphatase
MDPRALRHARLDMLLIDHGVLRLAWRNFHQVHPGVWRSAQPDPGQIARLAARGFRAVLNLRGDTGQGAYLLERDACARYGLDLVNLKLHARALPEVGLVRRLDTVFGEIARPFVMHCKSGADRGGFAAALYLLLHTDVAVARAKAQLSPRYLHFRQSRAGILDYMLEAYRAEAEAEGIGFRDWVYSRYDPAALTARYRSRAADFGVDRVLHRE